MNRYEKIQTLCKQRGISIRKLENDLQFSNGYISKMKSSKPNADAIAKIAWYFQIPAESLDNDESRNEEWIKKHYLSRPLYRVSAGQGAYNDVYADETISIDDTDSGYEFIEVVGDSMYPVLHDGDIVKVKLTTETEPHDLSVVKVDGESSTIKYCELVSDGLWLKAENKDVFKDRFYSVQEVVTLPISIIGKVVELRRKF